MAFINLMKLPLSSSLFNFLNKQTNKQKECRLHRISSKKKKNTKQTAAITTTNPGEGEWRMESDFLNSILYYFTYFDFNKNYGTCKKTGK